MILWANIFGHEYYVYGTGVDLKPKSFKTRVEANAYMRNYCDTHNITGIEITEDDKHFKKYSNHRGVRFYINRI